MSLFSALFKKHEHEWPEWSDDTCIKRRECKCGSRQFIGKHEFVPSGQHSKDYIAESLMPGYARYFKLVDVACERCKHLAIIKVWEE